MAGGKEREGWLSVIIIVNAVSDLLRPFFSFLSLCFLLSSGLSFSLSLSLPSVIRAIGVCLRTRRCGSTLLCPYACTCVVDVVDIVVVVFSLPPPRSVDEIR